ncbi:MAG: hypothetical protein F6J95_029150 [Leptolyngbya sp. SIO1E4]|nr:hypothetical protein [Leptolyngbya sp. SIO1E4]
MRKNPSLASFYSLLLPGSGGLFYIGQNAKGFWMLIFFIASTAGLYSFGISLLFILIIGASDAGNIAQIEGKNTFLVIFLSFIFLGGGGHFLLGKPGRGILFIFSAILVTIPMVGGIFAIIIGMKEAYGMAIRKNNFGSLKSWEYTWDYQAKPEQIRFLDEEKIETEDIIVSTEEVPLDNRFGSNSIISEHEFIQTASSSLKINETQHLSGRFKVGFQILEGELQGHISKNLGIDLGHQITRRVNVKFEVEAGKYVIYRIVWKQNFRKGIVRAAKGRQVFKVPYDVTYGLYHSIDSIECP